MTTATAGGSGVADSSAFSTAERRAFGQVSTDQGRIAVLAADQRASLARMLAGAGRPSDAAEVLRVKADIVATLAGSATGVLLDPEIALPALVDSATVPRDRALLVSVERSLDRSEPAGRVPALIPGFGAAGVRRLGGTLAKLLVCLRVDRPDQADTVLGVVRSVLADCHAASLLLVVEALVLKDADEDADAFGRRAPALIRDAAVAVAETGVAMLKLPYPGSEAASQAVTEAARRPWAVLSGGVGFDAFGQQLDRALAGGAAGFVAGRAVWQEAVPLAPAERLGHLREVGRKRLESLTARLDGRGSTWQDWDNDAARRG
ncbi:MAG: tagatose-bisphosphate aldolase [Actinomycetota bacterium]|nr:tagatose-bisphosphate aldolase [Actinomycetota bacterium]